MPISLTPSAAPASTGTTLGDLRTRAKAIYEEGVTSAIADSTGAADWIALINQAQNEVAAKTLCLRTHQSIATARDGVATIAVTGTMSVAYTTSAVGIAGGAGSGAEAIARLSSTGAVSSIRVTEKGSGYTSAPTVTVAGGSGQTFTAALGSPASYNIDDDMIYVEQVTYNGRPLDPAGDDLLQGWFYNWRDGSAGTPIYYYIESLNIGAKIVLFPRPSGIGDVIEIFGRKIPTTLVETTDGCEIPPPYDQLVVWRAVIHACLRTMSDPMSNAKYAMCRAEYNNLLPDYKSQVNQPDFRRIIMGSMQDTDGGWPPVTIHLPVGQ